MGNVRAPWPPATYEGVQPLPFAHAKQHRRVDAIGLVG